MRYNEELPEQLENEILSYLKLIKTTKNKHIKILEEVRKICFQYNSDYTVSYEKPVYNKEAIRFHMTRHENRKSHIQRYHSYIEYL